MAYGFGPSRRARIAHADEDQQPDPMAEGIRAQGGVPKEATPAGSLTSAFQRLDFDATKEWDLFTIPWRASLDIDVDPSLAGVAGTNAINTTIRVYAVTGGVRALIASGTVKIGTKGSRVLSVRGAGCERYLVTVQNGKGVKATLFFAYSAYGFDPTTRQPNTRWVKTVGYQNNVLLVAGPVLLYQAIGRAGGPGAGVAPGQSIVLVDALAAPAGSGEYSIPIAENVPFSLDLGDRPRLFVNGIWLVTSGLADGTIVPGAPAGQVFCTSEIEDA